MPVLLSALLQPDPGEVVIAPSDRLVIGLDRLPVVLPLALLLRAVHADDLRIEHAHDPAARKIGPAPIAALRVEKVIPHLISPPRQSPR